MANLWFISLFILGSAPIHTAQEGVHQELRCPSPFADKEGEGKEGEQPVEVVVPSEVQLEAIAEEVQASWRLKEAHARPSCY